MKQSAISSTSANNMLDDFRKRIEALPDDAYGKASALKHLAAAQQNPLASGQQAALALAYLAMGGDKYQPTNEHEQIRHDIVTYLDRLDPPKISEPQRRRRRKGTDTQTSSD